MATKVKSFDHACEITGTDPNVLPNVTGLPEITGKALIAFYKLVIIQKATNGNWKADYSKSSQWKYYPWFEWVPSRSAFVFTFTSYTNTDPDLGSRFCFETRDTARYIGEQFADLYNDIMREA